MYNKLFAKIVRSSIWLEPTPTRLVWFMFIALMDEAGFVQFASIANVAHTARIPESEAEEAIKILESPDENSADPDNEGKRIERVPGGWMVLNSEKYRDLVTREMVREQTRVRVARHRAKDNVNVTQCNAAVTKRNEKVTPSDTDTEKEKRGANGSRPQSVGEFLKELAADKTYEGLDVRREYGKMVRWCSARKKQPTRRRFINWLNGADQVLRLKTEPTTTVYGKRYLPPINEPTEAELAAQRKIVREASEKLRAEFNR